MQCNLDIVSNKLEENHSFFAKLTLKNNIGNIVV